MVVREATIRSAQYGIGLDAAQKGFDGRLRGYQASVARSERRLAKQAERLDRQISSAPASNPSSLSPTELEAHREARFAALRAPKLQALKAVEEHRAYRSAASGEAAMEARGRTKLTRVEAAQVLIASGMEAYEASLRRSGLDNKTVTDMVARERQHRDNAVGLKPDQAAERQMMLRSDGAGQWQGAAAPVTVETEAEISARNHGRVNALAEQLAQRNPISANLTSLNESDRERQIHDQALTASRIETAHIAGMIRNNEVDRVRTMFGDRESTSNRDFLAAWGENALSKEEAARLIHAAELQGYSNHLKAAGLSDERVDRFVAYEDEARRAHLGLPSFVNDSRAGQQQIESSRAHFDSFERLADLSSTAIVADDLANSSRMNREEIKALAGELEFAAREAYAQDHNVSLSEAAAVVKISQEEVRSAVVDIERDRLETLREQDRMAEEDRQMDAELQHLREAKVEVIQQHLAEFEKTRGVTFSVGERAEIALRVVLQEELDATPGIPSPDREETIAAEYEPMIWSMELDKIAAADRSSADLNESARLQRDANVAVEWMEANDVKPRSEAAKALYAEISEQIQAERAEELTVAPEIAALEAEREAEREREAQDHAAEIEEHRARYAAVTTATGELERVAITLNKLDPIRDGAKFRELGAEAREHYDMLKSWDAKPKEGAAKDLYSRFERIDARKERDRSAELSMSM
ncbi:hypothetical protein [Bosea sp. (in: a-proteobacteria)]|uniref:hypothetical protein n=1 Tax=Bosea sp. (in: a-proteobacteria) TaxID=1871050 RepID=UPI001AD4D6BB|nr:hypothetical protein [Bosea sp. (in: a-proteobacteria)]MBN9440659.1 hypothetical protein [Bosea sp. (in: a-proteobacteria)]